MKKNGINHFLAAYLLVISLGVSAAHAGNENTLDSTLSSTSMALPLTGNEVTDQQFYQRLTQAIERQSVTQPLTPLLAKRFNDLKDAVGLDLSDLRLAAKGLSTVRAEKGAIGSNHIVINPENIKTMPLGASLWTDQSMFSRRSIFDSGVLIGRSLIPNLQGNTESGQSTKVSSRTDKDTTSKKFSLDFGVSARFGGFHSSAGYKHDEASENTKMNGGAAASIYNYATNTIRIEPEQASNYLELRGALRGVALGEDEIKSYISIVTNRVNPSDTNDTDTFEQVKVIKNYDGQSPPSAQSPRAHVQALILLEDAFGRLSAQLLKYQNNKAIQQQTLLEMQELKNAINASIKAFYTNYGDSFVTEVSGYSEVQGVGQLVQESKSNNFERNNAGTMTGGYSNFIGGGETSTSVSQWLKEANAYGALSVKTTVYQKPNNGVDLSGYSASLNTWLNSAITSTGTSAQLPPVAITPSLPTLPTVRPWQDDPFGPPVKSKDFDDWTKSRDAFKDSKGYKIPAWLKKKNDAEGVPVPENAAGAQQAVAELNNAGNGRPVSENVDEIPIPDDIPNPPDLRGSGMAEAMVESILIPPANQSVRNEPNSQSNAISPHQTFPQKKGQSLYGRKLYNDIRHELRSLKAYGIKVKAQERRQARLSGAWLANGGMKDSRVVATSAPEVNEISLDKMMVSSFKGLPFSAVLVALRPNLELPVSLDLDTVGFINTSVLLATLNRYYTLDTYLNFIKSVPESGLGRTAISDNLHKYVSHLEEIIMDLVQSSMTSGDDISDEAMAAVLNQEITGLSSDGKARDPSKTELFRYLKSSSDAYDYVYRLAEDPDYYRVIGKAPGGYLPFAPMAGGGYCLPKWSDIRRLSDTNSTTVSGFNVSYLRASECIEVTANTDIPKLLGGSPQTPLFPLYIFVEGKNPPLLNFVQFVGGSRLIIGRDVTLAPPAGDVTSIPRVPWENASSADNQVMGYQGSLLADTNRLNAILTRGERPAFVDGRTNDPYVNAFLPSDMSWRYSIWFPKNDSASLDGYGKYQVLSARIGYYPSYYRRPLMGDSDTHTLTREGVMTSSAYSLSLTYQFLEPFSFQFCVYSPGCDTYKIPGGYTLEKYHNGLRDTYPIPDNNYLIGPTKPLDGKNKTVIGKISLRDFGDAPGTKYTGGLMLLYPVTTDMLQGLGTGAFAYSSGSSPKDIFSQDDRGNSPFDAGFTKALLQK